MGEILFKAKRIDTGEWVEGGYVYTFNEDRSCHIVGVMTKNHWIVEENGNIVIVDKDTICQFTGLFDKDGNKIWENDILWDSEERTFYKMVWCQDSMRYCVENADGFDYEFDSAYSSMLERNGNVFDNAELLKE